jgi:hypothetical protein
MALWSKIRVRMTYANVTATLALFVALGGGSFAVAALSGSEKKVVKKIARKQADRRINARAPRTFVHFEATIGTVPAEGCVTRQITGIDAAKDHLLPTPNFNTTSSNLIFTIAYYDNQEYAYLQACNPTAGAIDEGSGRFNLMVFDTK